jgi:mutator protein MutT
MRPVVGAAVLRGGRVLAARRTTPAAAAGRWELPGGKVEPGQSPAAAVVREVGEELSCIVEVTGWLAGSSPIGTGHVLTVALVRLVAGEPRPGEHDRLRWLAADELDDVDWLEPDRPFLAELARVLHGDGRAGDGRAGDGREGTMGAVRGIFFEEDDARAVVARLTGAGFDAAVVRERLSGEDDDEDHPWAVLTDAPPLVLELLVDEYDGWLDAEPGTVSPPAPLDLPSAPRRVKRP